MRIEMAIIRPSINIIMKAQRNLCESFIFKSTQSSRYHANKGKLKSQERAVKPQN